MPSFGYFFLGFAVRLNKSKSHQDLPKPMLYKTDYRSLRISYLMNFQKLRIMTRLFSLPIIKSTLILINLQCPYLTFGQIVNALQADVKDSTTSLVICFSVFNQFPSIF